MSESPKTLPEWNRATGNQIDIDRVRKTISKTPELKKLGTRIGPTMAYTRAEFDQIIAATRASLQTAS